VFKEITNKATDEIVKQFTTILGVGEYPPGPFTQSAKLTAEFLEVYERTTSRPGIASSTIFQAAPLSLVWSDTKDCACRFSAHLTSPPPRLLKTVDDKHLHR
jgi:hypothetical protein